MSTPITYVGNPPTMAKGLKPASKGPAAKSPSKAKGKTNSVVQKKAAKPVTTPVAESPKPTPKPKPKPIDPANAEGNDASGPALSSKERHKAKRKMRKALRKQKAKEHQKARKEAQQQNADSTGAAKDKQKQKQKQKPVKQLTENKEQEPVKQEPKQKPVKQAAEKKEQEQEPKQKPVKQAENKEQEPVNQEPKQKPVKQAEKKEQGQKPAKQAADKKEPKQTQVSEKKQGANKRPNPSTESSTQSPATNTAAASATSPIESQKKKSKTETENVSSKVDNSNNTSAVTTNEEKKNVSNWALLKSKLSKEKSKRLNIQQQTTAAPSDTTPKPMDTLFDISKVTEEVAVDCEMVGTGPKGSKSILARIAIVNNLGETIYHKYVKPTEYVTDYRFHITGIKHTDIQNGEPFHVVRSEVSKIFRNKVLVGHGLDNDLKVLKLNHKPELIRDTARHKPLMIEGIKARSLKDLAKDILGKTIQSGTHSPIEDACSAMQIYLKVKSSWTS